MPFLKKLTGQGIFLLQMLVTGRWILDETGIKNLGPYIQDQESRNQYPIFIGFGLSAIGYWAGLSGLGLKIELKCQEIPCMCQTSDNLSTVLGQKKGRNMLPHHVRPTEKGGRR